MARPSFTDMLQQPGRHAFGQSLYLTVRGPNSARWEYQHRVAGVLRSAWWPAIGPGALSLTQARAERARVWLENRAGEQPRNRVLKVTGKLFSDVVPEWLAVAAASWADKTRDGVSRALLRLPFASKDIGKIKTDDTLPALLALPDRQRQDVRQNLARVFDFAAGRKYLTFDADGNPAKFEATRRELWPTFKKSDNHHADIAADELAAVLRKLPDNEAGRAARFAALTVARAGEVEGATWAEVVGENGTSAWIVPAERMKAGKAHRVPLAPQALALLGKRGADDSPLFVLKSNQILNAIKKASPGATAHGLRTTFKTWASEAGKDRELTERSLAHGFGSKVENAYQRSDLFDRRRELINEWAAFATRR